MGAEYPASEQCMGGPRAIPPEETSIDERPCDRAPKFQLADRGAAGGDGDAARGGGAGGAARERGAGGREPDGAAALAEAPRAVRFAGGAPTAGGLQRADGGAGGSGGGDD